MERHPDLTRALAHAHITDMLTSAARRHHNRALPHPIWRRVAGTTLVRIGEALLGNARSSANSATLFPAPATR